MRDPFSYVFFPHRGRNIGAFVHRSHDGLFRFEIQDYFFREAELYSIPLDGAAQISKSCGYAWSDTRTQVVDINRFITFVYYEHGKIHSAHTGTDKMVHIFPHLGFNFLVDLQNAVMESPDFPEVFKQNLGRVRHITTLDDYFKELPTHVPIDERFGRRYIAEVLKKPEYLPENIRSV